MANKRRVSAKTTRNTDDSALLARITANPPQRVVLDNGITVITCENHEAALVTVQLWVKTGSIHEGELIGSGVSHYLEHMLFKGTGRRSAAAISAEIQSEGGYINAYTSFDRTVYYVEMPSAAFGVGLDVLADMFRNSLIDREEVERERGVILREIAMCEDEPDHQVAQALFRTAFRQHPYRYPVIGLPSRFERLTHDDLLSYYRGRYVPEKLTVVIVGAVPTEEMLEAVRQHFGDFSGTSPGKDLIADELPQFTPRTERMYGDVQVTRGAMAWKIPGLLDPVSPAIGVLASALGGGQSSILWQRLREELNLVHEIDAFVWNPGQTGLFWVSYVCDPDKRSAAEAAILEELRRFPQCSDIGERIARARRQAIVSEINSYKTIGGRASRIGMAELLVGDVDFTRTYLKRLAAVTEEDIVAASVAHLVDSGLTTISFEPEKLRDQQSTSVVSGNRLPPFTEHVLDNGVRLLLQPYSSYPKVHLRVGLLGGPYYESPETAGITCLAATLMTKDAGGRSSLAIAEELESKGISFNDFSGDNSFGFSLEGLSDDFQLLVETAGAALFEADFREETIARERAAQIARIEELQDDVVDYGRSLLRGMFLAGTPWGIDPLGTVDSVSALDGQKLSEFLNERRVGDGVVVALSGDFDPDVALSSLSEVFGKVASGRVSLPVPLGPEMFREGDGITSHQHPLDRKQTIVFQAYPCSGALEVDGIVPGAVLREMLSGMSSQLFLRVREEQGLAYFVSASMQSSLGAGMLALFAGIEKFAMETVYAEFDAEIDRIRSGRYSDEELAGCKNRLKAQYLMASQTIGARAGSAVNCVLYQRDLKWLEDYNQRVDSLTRADFDAFAERWLQSSRAVRFTIGNI